eukprot:gene24394-22517_t
MFEEKEVGDDRRVQNHNILQCFNALESGTGGSQGMGTKSMLNAEPLQTKAGDLPFCYTLDHPMHDAYVSLSSRFLKEGDMQTATPDSLQKLVDLIKGFVGKLSEEDVRLLLFYSAFKCFFGECKTHPQADELAHHKELKEKLSLNSKQQRLLWLALNRKKMFDYTEGGTSAPAEVGITDSLMKGHKDDWTDTLTTCISIACALPNSFLATLTYDIESSKEHYTPGDRTNAPVQNGGCYQFDCVTQLDHNGNITAYARNQPVMSAGACYLLWGVEFSLLAFQLLMFGDNSATLDTLWNWMFSPDIQSRQWGVQQGKSNYRHLCDEIVQRGLTYHLWMGVKTGISPDEAQRLYAFLLSHMFDDRAKPLKDGGAA